MRPFTFYKAAKHCRSITIPSVLRFDTSTRDGGSTDENRLLSGGEGIFERDCSMNFREWREISLTQSRETDRVWLTYRISFFSKMWIISKMEVTIYVIIDHFSQTSLKRQSCNRDESEGRNWASTLRREGKDREIFVSDINLSTLTRQRGENF